MYTYEALVKVYSSPANSTSYTSVRVRIQAENDYAARMILESQYGPGTVWHYSRISEL